MKKFRQLCLAGVLALALATATLAGEISTPGSPQPPPPTQSSAKTPGATQNLQAMADSVADIALNLLQTILSVF